MVGVESQAIRRASPTAKRQLFILYMLIMGVLAALAFWAVGQAQFRIGIVTLQWQLALVLLLGGFLLLMAAGLPVAFSFLTVTTVGVYIWWGGEIGLRQLGLTLYESLVAFEFMPLPLFILMGELLFHSGIGANIIDGLDKWLGRVPGRLGLLAVGAGTVLGTLTGASIGSVAILGSQLVPEMHKRGYKKPMSVGPVLGSGGLAIMIPPSSLAVVVAAIGEISIGRTLLGIIVPGLLMAALYGAYIIIRCLLQPDLAPAYEPAPTPLAERVWVFVRDVLPVGIVVFLVTGVIFLGIAGPSEAAATGLAGTFILLAINRRLTWRAVRKSFLSTVEITVMIFIIIAAAKGFTQMLVFSGATGGLLQSATSLSLAPLVVVTAMMVVVFFLGMFMGPVSIAMICLPVFVPIMRSLGLSPIWFAAMFLINLEMATTSPPYGASLFVMKAVAPPDVTMGDCIRGAIPFLVCDAVAIVLIMFFPSIALWLPGQMMGTG